MDKCKVYLVLSLFSLINVNADTRCNLKEIFKTPQRRNYDQLEIVERSNFLSDEPIRAEKCKSDFDVPNENIFLRFGDYSNAIRRNNNNVNTRITLAGPNHNNYYTPVIQPYYAQVQYPLNLVYPVPRIPRSNVILPSPYVPPYQVIPHVFPEQTCHQKPRIIIDDPIVFESSSIQHIDLPSQRNEEILPGNGLNTMTVIPKIIIDNVVKQPLISKDFELEVEPCKTLPEIDASLPCALEQEEKSICKKQLPVLEVVSPVVVEDIRNPETITISPAEQNDVIQQISCEHKNAAVIRHENDIVIQEPDIVSDCGCKSKEDITLCDTKCDEIPKDVLTSEVPREIHNIDHPRVLHPVKLSNDIENVEILGAGNVNISLGDNCPQRIEKYENAEDVALEHLLQKSLVPFINLKTNDKPKLLVSYPVVGNPKELIPEHPSAIIVRTLKPVHTYCSKCSSCRNRRPKIIDIDNLNIIRSTPIIPVVEVVPNNICKCSNEVHVSSSQTLAGVDGCTESVVSGYKVSSGSGCYEDPLKKIIYQRPTEVTVLAPQLSKCNTNLVYSQLPLALQRPLSSEKGIFVDSSPDFVMPSPLEKTPRSLDLLKYLVSDILSPKKTLICPYCSNEIKIVPTIVRHPYDLCNQDPIIEKISCPYTPLSGRNIEGVWIPKPLEPRCPYCAKYRGELNQLA